MWVGFGGGGILSIRNDGEGTHSCRRIGKNIKVQCPPSPHTQGVSAHVFSPLGIGQVECTPRGAVLLSIGGKQSRKERAAPGSIAEYLVGDADHRPLHSPCMLLIPTWNDHCDDCGFGWRDQGGGGGREICEMLNEEVCCHCSCKLGDARTVA